MSFFIYAPDRDEEFFESIPEKSVDFMKTVCAFGNSKGGTLVFDVTGRDVYSAIRSLKNDISYCSEPKTTPRYSVVTANGKVYVAVGIDEGRQKPYHFFWAGMDMGAYVRRDKKTVPADKETERELYRYCTKESYDDERSPGDCAVKIVASETLTLSGDIGNVVSRALERIGTVLERPASPVKELILLSLMLASPCRGEPVTIAADKDSAVFTVPGGVAAGESPEDTANGRFTPKNYGIAKLVDEVFAPDGGCAGVFMKISEAFADGTAKVSAANGGADLVITL